MASTTTMAASITAVAVLATIAFLVSPIHSFVLPSPSSSYIASSTPRPLLSPSQLPQDHRRHHCRRQHQHQHPFEAPWTPSTSSSPTSSASTRLYAALDPVTYLRTEWVSAALCTNQTPRAADKCLQLGTEDGRIVNFVPRTIREIVTSSAEGRDEGLSVGCERQLKQMAERRGSAVKITYSNQPADDLRDTPSDSIDVVISLQAAQRMAENGLDWKKSIREAGRVLKPGGRFLFVESRMVKSAAAGGKEEDYLEYVLGLSEMNGDAAAAAADDVVNEEVESGVSSIEAAAASNDDETSTITATTATATMKQQQQQPPIFQEVGFDDVDMVLQPHVAGVAIKAMDADLSLEERKSKKEMEAKKEEEDRLAERAMSAFERGNKRRKRKKKKGAGAGGGGGEEEED